MEIKIEHLNKNYGKKKCIKGYIFTYSCWYVWSARRKRFWKNNAHAYIGNYVRSVNRHSTNKWG